MFASSVTTIGRPCALAPAVHFADRRTVCFGVENGVLFEDVNTGHQKHLWVSNQQGAEVSVGQPLIATDLANGQMAMHQPASNHIEILSLETLLVKDKLSARLPGRDMVVTWLHLSFSSDGLRLAVVGQGQCSILDVYKRKDPFSPFELLCTLDTLSKGTPAAPKFFPADPSFISVADDSCVSIIRTESFCGQVDCKERPVSLFALDASNAITAHAWISSGDLLVGSAHGLLFLVHGAARMGESKAQAGSQFRTLQAVPLLLSELSKWNAGAIVAIHASISQLILVMECPDGKGGLVFSFAIDVTQLHSTESHVLRHVELPTSRTLAALQSPDNQHIAVVDDMARVVVVPTTLSGSCAARVASFGLSGLGPVLSVASVKGLHASGSVLLMTLQDSGALQLYMLEQAARVSDDLIAPRATLLRSARLGQPGAAMDTHPSVPIVAVATTAGVVQLIDAEQFQSSTAPELDATATPPGIVHFSVYCLPPGSDKMLRWSPDGSSLLSVDCVSGVISFMESRVHPHKDGQRILSLLGHYSAPNSSLVQWHQCGACSPLLIVHESNGLLLVLDVPQSASDADDMFLPPGSLQRSKFRLSTPLVDMRISQQHSSSGHASIVGVTWDCSIRRFKVSTERIRAATTKRGASTFAPAAPVDAEVLQALPASPANMELSARGDSMFVATRSGSVVRVKMPSLEILQPCLPVCGSAPKCCSAMLHLQGDKELLIVGNRAGGMSAMHLVEDEPESPADECTVVPSIPDGLRGAVSGVLRLSVKTTSENFRLPLGAELSPSLIEAEKAILAKSKESELGVWKEHVDNKMKSITTALRRVKERNSAYSSAEQLPADDLTVCDVLAQHMRAHGKKSNQTLRECLRKQVMSEGCKAQNVMADTWHANKKQCRILQPLKMYSPISPFDSTQDSRSRGYSLPVESMAEPRCSEHEEKLVQYMTFIRRVEQIEFENRPVAVRGLCATIPVHVSDSEENAEVDGGTHEYNARMSETSRTMSMYIRDVFAFSDVRNGESLILYSPLQQHLLRRKLAQIRLLTAEIIELRCSYNQKFDAVCASKQSAITKIEGNLERINTIQVELGLTVMSSWSSNNIEEDETRCIRVEPHEMTTTPWVSPAERALIEQEKAKKEALRRAAEADTSRSRALLNMMDSNPAIRKPDAFEHLVREPWMDMPLKSMTKAQREALREFDKKVQEVEESLRNAVRIAEGERKMLEEEIMDVIVKFNGQLMELHHECIRNRMKIASAERERLALIFSSTGVQDIRAAHDAAATTVSTQSARMSIVRKNLDMLSTHFATQQAEYFSLQRTSKQLDRALPKIFQHLEARMPVVEATYRYGVEVGSGVRPDPSDVLVDAVGAAGARTGNAGPSNDDAPGMSALKNWRPANNLPQAATWKSGPAFTDDDRPEGIEKDDWLQLMTLRDCKLGVLEQVEDCWKGCATTIALLDDYKAELEFISKLIHSSMEWQRQTDQQVAEACMNVPVVLTCKGAQVEVTEEVLIPDLEDAVLLPISSVNLLNTHVVLQAEKVLECLRACRDFKRGIHLSSWGISQAELAQQHKQEHVKELQLLHIPRAVQDVLLSGEAAVSQDSAQLKVLEKVRDLHKHMHASSTLIKAKKFSSLTEDVASRLKSNEELTMATDEAKQFRKKQAHIETLVQYTDAQQATQRQNRLKQITFRTRLREVAMAQMQELASLKEKKNKWIRRSFPTFAARNSAMV